MTIESVVPPELGDRNVELKTLGERNAVELQESLEHDP
jgi:hypothetical protein